MISKENVKKLPVEVLEQLEFQIKSFFIDVKASTKEVIKAMISLESKGMIVAGFAIYNVASEVFEFDKNDLSFLDGGKSFVFDNNGVEVKYEDVCFSRHCDILRTKLYVDIFKDEPDWVKDAIKIMKSFSSKDLYMESTY